MTLSKSDFLKYQICPSYFWLWKNKPKLVPKDDEEVIKEKLKRGIEFEELVRTLYPDYFMIKSFGQHAADTTKELLADGASNLFQATVVTDNGLLAMADILRQKSDGSFMLCEVKSTSKIKDNHITDLAFQKTAFEKSGFAISEVRLIHLKKKYVRLADLNVQNLIEDTDVTERVDKVAEAISNQIDHALELMLQPSEPRTCSCDISAIAKHCPTFNYFHKDIPEYSVYNISRLRGKKLEGLIDSDILELTDIPDDYPLSQIQQNQVMASKTKQPQVDAAGIKQNLAELEYPLYFLDYETVNMPIPIFYGTTPYQQVPFQYSLHVINSPGDEPKHYEFIGRDLSKNPSEDLLSSMSKYIQDSGSVVTWNKSFEMKRNEEMAALYPQHADLLESINKRAFDLQVVFGQQLYVDHRFLGKTSIKNILPVLAPKLNYKDLEVQNGSMAQLTWLRLVSGELADKNPVDVFDALLKYCKLDTLAMVRIYNFLTDIELQNIGGTRHKS